MAIRTAVRAASCKIEEFFMGRCLHPIEMSLSPPYRMSQPSGSGGGRVGPPARQDFPSWMENLSFRRTTGALTQRRRLDLQGVFAQIGIVAPVWVWMSLTGAGSPGSSSHDVTLGEFPS